MLKRDEKELTKLDIIITIVDFKNSLTGKSDLSKLNVSLIFVGNVPLNALVSFSEIAGAADVSFVS